MTPAEPSLFTFDFPESSAPGSLTHMSAPNLYATLFEASPVAILEEDWSGPKRQVEAVLASGITDFEKFLDEHPNFVFEARREHRVVDANTAAMKLFGHSNKRAFLASARTLLPADPKSNAVVLKAFAQREQSAQGERLLRTAGGTQVPVLWRAVIPPANGDFCRLLFYAVDVSVLKQAEDALTATRAQLAVASRIAVIGEMTASIAHEINQPLGAIRILADSALRWLNRPMPRVDRARRSISELCSSAERAGSIVRRVKDLLGSEPPQTQPLSLDKAVKDAFLLVERDALEAVVTLVVAIPSNVPSVQAETTQLQQVFVNLFTNAIHAMAAENVADRTLQVSASVIEHGLVLVAVEDRGPGFSADISDRIFERFFSTKAEGTGLGLSICRSIVEAHGGTIGADNRVGGGATFKFTLRAAEK